MDINSLLSPQESPAAETPPPSYPPSSSTFASPSPSLSAGVHSPAKSKRPPARHMPSRTPSGLREQILSSTTPAAHFNHHSHQQQQQQQPPLPHPHQHLQQHPHEAVSSPTPPTSNAYQHIQHQHPPPPPQSSAVHSPSFGSYTNGRTAHSSHSAHSATSTPPAVDARMHMGGSPQASTPGMDTLADLAAMQHSQQARQQTVVQRPSISLQNIPRSISGGSTADVTMVDSPKLPRSFYSKHLDAQSIEGLNQLEKALIENPFDYYSHVHFITLLHQGLQNVLYAADGSSADPYSYELLPVLRDAYKAMDSKYTLGEQLWDFRINDEKILARSAEDHMALLELCQRATQEEPYSVKLWVLYGDYISQLIASAWDASPQRTWSDDDQAMGKEIFTADLLMSTWQSGAEHVKHNISESNLVWDRYLQLLQDDLERQFTPDKARKVANAFAERLGLPHETWDHTLSLFSSYNSKYNNSGYEAAMERAVRQNSHVKKTYESRSGYEFSLARAVQNKDYDAEYHAMTRYLKWEKKTMGPYSFPIVNALYERATLRFPVDPALWEDYVEFLIWKEDRSVSLLDVLQRATRHCPWSGSLWCHRILTLEAEGRNDEIEGVKHNATETGMLDHADLEELIKVQIAWCGYLRRKAFDNANATEDDPDYAEMGIREALETANRLGERKNGKGWRDPQYRLERIYIKFRTQRNDLDGARQIFDDIATFRADSYDFWYRWYIWEMVVWSNQAIRTKNNEGQELLTPSAATAVLERGLKGLNTIDHPEPLLEMYLNHCEQHESAVQVRHAIIEKRRFDRLLGIRRQQERAAAEAEAEAEAEAGSVVESNQVVDGSGKRKRENAAEVDGLVAKKSRHVEVEELPAVAPSVEDATRPVSEAPSTHSTTQKRDREHSSIIVRDLPKDVTQMRLRQFFTDAGNVKDVVLRPEGDTVTATVEFDTPEEAEYALLKEAKGFAGHAITISRGESSTLYVTNYPGHIKQEDLRDMFKPFGEILDMRFPSLKFRTTRRFVYVQFSNASEAIAALKLDGTDVEGLALSVKISDPTAKKPKRESAADQKREVFLRRLNYKVKKSQIEKEFSKFGNIQYISLPLIDQGYHKGNNKGICYIAYESPESASAAVAEMNGKQIWDMQLTAEIAKTRNELNKNIHHTKVTNTASPEPRGSTPSHAADKSNTKDQDKDYAPVSDRSIALLGIPDTVPHERIADLVKPYNYKVVTHFPKNGGAIIEFHDVASVGTASLALEGTTEELKKAKAAYRPGTNLEGAKKGVENGTTGAKSKAKGKAVMQPRSVGPAKPVVRGGSMLRGRGRPGLGFAGSRAQTQGTGQGQGIEGGAKSNEQFRALLLGGKKEGNKEGEKDVKRDGKGDVHMDDGA
ncbi:hypothetical protein B0J11DRAFT_547853 [Dendryphion nanum]|uniref:U4/U6 snRNA-associated-splicing factor PRP24 n=1 Tax=Dendryphion nanum TaxID=256645 RepID=A0A9P9IXS7_9PLEO|nr:hypothetical protein B0J11DRAFT_547853 [Dendryphion nanum]